MICEVCGEKTTKEDLFINMCNMCYEKQRENEHN